MEKLNIKFKWYTIKSALWELTQTNFNLSFFAPDLTSPIRSAFVCLPYLSLYGLVIKAQNVQKILKVQ